MNENEKTIKAPQKSFLRRIFEEIAAAFSDLSDGKN